MRRITVQPRRSQPIRVPPIPDLPRRQIERRRPGRQRHVRAHEGLPDRDCQLFAVRTVYRRHRAGIAPLHPA
ncbi:MAG TPA: hypothetical protein VFU86_08715, partial [Terriglobales bacterium]|nr:hypothetical protein [Terriglobales bacterium]